MSLAPIPVLSGVKSHDQRFNPYDDNGGSIIAIGGDNFALIASDTRLSTGYSIYTRNQSKLFKLGKKMILGSSGCWCDTLTLHRTLNARMQIYLHEHNKEMSTGAVAQMLMTMLYSKRFFPYYVSNLLAGVEPDGSGWVFHYDPIGNFERSKFHASGSSGAFLQPLLDNQLGLNNMENVEAQPVTIDSATKIVKDAFNSAAERDIYVGDRIHFMYITKDGITEDFAELRKD